MNGYDLVRLQPNQVKKSGDTMTGNLTMSGGAKVIGNLQGNADTASRLNPGASINGVPFNGASNINIPVTGTTVNLNGYQKPNQGGAINANDSLNSAIGKLEVNLDGKANATHTHQYAGSNTAGGAANNSLKINGKNIFVQQGQPNAQAVGDIWISW